MAKNLSEGHITKNIVLFAMPLLLGNVFQLLYGLADSIVVGKYISADALAAVTTSGPILHGLIAFILGLGIGATVVLSQYYGAGSTRDVRLTQSTALIFLFAAAAVLSIAGIVLTNPLLKLLKVDPDIIEDAAVYLRTIFAGILFLMAYNAFSSILRAVGDSVSPLIFLIIASLINIGLDILFVAVFSMGVFGVALATIIAQFISAVCCYIYMYKKVPALRLRLKDYVFDMQKFRQVIKMGLPTAIQQTIIAFGALGVQGLVNSYGKITTAAYGAANRVEQIVFLPIMSFGNAVGVFSSQNVGAGKPERVQKGLFAALRLVVLSSAVTAVALLLFGENIMMLFLKSSETNLAEIIRQGTAYMNVVAYFCILIGVLFVYNSVLRGTGDVMASMVSGIGNFMTRLIFAYILSRHTPLAYRGIWWSVPIGWLVGTVYSVARFYTGKWKTKSVVRGQMLGTAVQEMAEEENI